MDESLASHRNHLSIYSQNDELFNSQRNSTDYGRMSQATTISGSQLSLAGECKRSLESPIMTILFDPCDLSKAIQNIIDFYAKNIASKPRQIILVDETLYVTFCDFWRELWPRLFPQQIHDVKVDLNCLNLRLGCQASKPSGNNIRVVKFRSIEDLFRIMESIKRLPLIQWWTQDVMFARTLSLESKRHPNLCESFWINHIPLGKMYTIQPISCDTENNNNNNNMQINEQNNNNDLIVQGRCEPDCLDELIAPMDTDYLINIRQLYGDISEDYEPQISSLRRQQAYFNAKMMESKRVGLILRVYMRLISKRKSMKRMGVSVGESVAQLRQFYQQNRIIITNPFWEGDSYVETYLRPRGLAIILATTKNCCKSRHLLVELIFKNLILGNGVLVVCLTTILGRRFPIQLIRDHKQIPFELIVFEASDHDLDHVLAHEIGVDDELLSINGMNSEFNADEEEEEELNKVNNHNSTTTTIRGQEQRLEITNELLEPNEEDQDDNDELIGKELDPKLELSSTPKVVRFLSRTGPQAVSVDSGLNESPQANHNNNNSNNIEHKQEQVKVPSYIYLIDLASMGKSVTNSAKVDDLILSYGTKRRSIWYPGKSDLESALQRPNDYLSLRNNGSGADSFAESETQSSWSLV